MHLAMLNWTPSRILFASTVVYLLSSASASRSPSCSLGTLSAGYTPTSATTVQIRGSSLLATVPIQASNGKFALPCPPPGDYILELISAIHFTDHLRITVDSGGGISTIEPRRDPMRVPGGGARVEGGVLSFPDVSEALYGEPEEARWAVVSYVFTFWNAAQVLVMAFLVAFPRYVGSLDREVLYEITGETPPDIGDPNYVLGSLISGKGREVRDVVASEVATVAGIN